MIHAAKMFVTPYMGVMIRRRTASHAMHEHTATVQSALACGVEANEAKPAAEGERILGPECRRTAARRRLARAKREGVVAGCSVISMRAEANSASREPRFTPAAMAVK